jgi:hypothetical protein
MVRDTPPSRYERKRDGPKPERHWFFFRLITAAALIFVGLETQAQAQRKSCPLTDAQSQKAVDAWAPIGNFLATEPRCVNCHGKVNPFVDGVGLDSSGDFDPAMPASVIKHGGGFQPHEHGGAIDQGCKDCHDNMAPQGDGSPSVNWTLAPSFLSFLDKDPTTLCIQIKRAIHDADHFLGHLKNDNGATNFAGTAFLGTRGLDADQYLDKDSPTYVAPAPPSITHDAVMQMAQNWLAAMGGKFQGDETCGCELKHSKWSGQIHYALDIKGDDGHNDLQEWSNHELSKTDVTVKDGFGAAQFYHDEKHIAVNRQRALRGGAITYIPNTSSGAEASGAGMSVASVEVEITPDQKNYTVSPTWIPVVIGKLHSYTCIRDTCTPGKDVDLGAGGMVTISGPLQDPNHLQGSSTDRKDNLGYSHKGVRIETIRWDLWRTAN